MNRTGGKGMALPEEAACTGPIGSFKCYPNNKKEETPRRLALESPF